MGRYEAQEFDDTVTINGYAACLDMISEGPIKGIVGGQQGIYLDENSLGSPINQQFVYQYTKDSFEEGRSFQPGIKNDGQIPILDQDFSQVKYIVDQFDSQKPLRQNIPIVININQETFPLVQEIKVILRFPRIYVQWNEELKKLYDDIDESGKLLYPKERNKVNRNVREKINGDIFQTPVLIKYYLEGDGQKLLEGNWLINEKQSQEVIFQFRIVPRSSILDAWKNTKNFKLKILRNTFDGAQTNIVDDCYISNILCIQDITCLYPNQAIAGLKFDAKDFGSFPERKYLCDLKIVKVPQNYYPPELNIDGSLKSGPYYDGLWDGQFKNAWTNNPAWIFYDLCTNKRYGAGDFIQSDKMDKWTLYQIGRYCDAVNTSGQFVGVQGDYGAEQRFTCNLFLTSQEQAYTVLNNLASTFRGMCYWNNNILQPQQDKLKNYAFQYTNANVIDGDFEYQTSEEKERRTVVQVRWNDPQDYYKAKTERYEDADGILKYGVNEAEIAAFGCTSRSQAYRAGRWMIKTELNEVEFVKFKLPFDGLLCRPGDIIRVQDNFRNGSNFGGRIAQMPLQNKVILDRIVDFSAYQNGWKIQVQIPKQNYEADDQANLNETTQKLIRTRQVETADIQNWEYQGDYTIVNLSQNLSTKINQVPFTIINSSDPTIQEKLYRIVGLKETEELQIEVTALEYYKEKFEEQETKLLNPTQINFNYQEYEIGQPTNLQFVVNQNAPAYLQYSYTPSTGQFVDYYNISGKYESDLYWVKLQQQKINWWKDGNYMVKIEAIQKGGKVSEPIQGSAYLYQDKNYNNQGFYVKRTLCNVTNLDQANEFRQPSPEWQFQSEDDDQSLAVDPEAFYIRITDSSTATVALDWTLVSGAQENYLKTKKIESGKIFDNIVQGWPFRSVLLETKQYGYGKLQNIYEQITKNTVLGGETVLIQDVKTGQFQYQIQNLSQDYSGVFIQVFTGVSSGIQPSYQGFYTQSYADVIHGLQVKDIYVQYKPYDTFIYNYSETYGPVQVQVFESEQQQAINSGKWTPVISGGYLQKQLWQQKFLEVTWPTQQGAALYQVQISGDNGFYQQFVTSKDYNLSIEYSGFARYFKKFTVNGIPDNGNYTAIVQKFDSNFIQDQIQEVQNVYGFQKDSFIQGDLNIVGNLNINGIKSNSVYDIQIDDSIAAPYTEQTNQYVQIQGVFKGQTISGFENYGVYQIPITGVYFGGGIPQRYREQGRLEGNFNGALVQGDAQDVTISGYYSGSVTDLLAFVPVDFQKSNMIGLKFKNSTKTIIYPSGLAQGAQYQVFSQNIGQECGIEFSGLHFPSQTYTGQYPVSGKRDMIQVFYNGDDDYQIYNEDFA